MTTVVIIDDSSVFRTLAGEVLRRQGLLVVGEAATVAEGIDAVRSKAPDVVLLDMGLPDGNGAQVAAAVASLARPPRVWAHSTDPEGWDVAFTVHDKSDLPGLDLRRVFA